MGLVIKQGDTKTALKAILKDENGAPIDLSKVNGITFLMADYKGNVLINRNAEVLSNEDSLVWFVFEPGETDKAGIMRAEFRVEYADGRIETFPNTKPITFEITPKIKG